MRVTFFREAFLSSFGHSFMCFVVDFLRVGPHGVSVLVSIFFQNKCHSSHSCDTYGSVVNSANKNISKNKQ